MRRSGWWQPTGMNKCLKALKLSKGTWHYRQNNYNENGCAADSKELITGVIQNNPGYGYRRIRRKLPEEHDIRNNHKKLKRLLNEWDLAIKREVSETSKIEVAKILTKASGTLNRVMGDKFRPF